MTLFESFSLLLYGTQLGVILWGIGWMKKSSESRAEQTIVLNKSMERQGSALERQGKVLEDIGVGIRDQSAALAKMGAGIERLLERNQHAA